MNQTITLAKTTTLHRSTVYNQIDTKETMTGEILKKKRHSRCEEKRKDDRQPPNSKRRDSLEPMRGWRKQGDASWPMNLHLALKWDHQDRLDHQQNGQNPSLLSGFLRPITKRPVFPWEIRWDPPRLHWTQEKTLSDNMPIRHCADGILVIQFWV